MTHQTTFEQAVAHHQAGRLDAAEPLYRRILEAQPDHSDALHMLGVLIGQRGQVAEAVELIQRAIALRPDSYECASNLGVFLTQMGRIEEAAATFARAAALEPTLAQAHHGYALALQALKRYEVAAIEFRRTVELAPDHADAYGGLGWSLLALDRKEEAAAAYRQCLALRPASAEAANNLGNVLRGLGRIDEAIELLGKAILLRPAFPEAHHNLGHALHAKGDLDQTIVCYRAATTHAPNFAEGWHNLGVALFSRGRFEESVAALQKAAALRPGFADTHHVLANALRESGKAVEAIEAYRRSIDLRPDFAESRINFGSLLQEQGQVEKAVEEFRIAIRFRPDIAVAHYNLGTGLQMKGELEPAAEAFRRALELDPSFAPAYVNLGNLLKDAGRLDDALNCYRKAQMLRPDSATAGNLLYGLYFHPGHGPGEIYREHALWNERFVRPLAASRRPHENDPTPGRRLRIGYVSPDFREHPIGRFMLPLLSHHDHGRFEIYCYSDVRHDTAMTGVLRRHADVWRNTNGMSDAHLANLVREDRIDVLVDLTMHMSGSRMLAFARKPAPVQATYLAYCGTTGSDAIDYRLTDPYLDPPVAGPGQGPADDNRCYSERSIHLHSYWCYLPVEDAPAVTPTPALAAGHVTFGCLNNFSKVSAPALEAWSILLSRVGNSRLILHTQKGNHREQILERFAARGVSADRIELVGHVSTGDYLALYGRIDIALDPFPYPGGTTSCDAIWMGVPLVTLAGQTAVSRGGASILHHLKLPELIATDAGQYVEIAAKLAADPLKLQALRTGLRDRMRASPLMDAPAFARDVENAYRRMWEAWCAWRRAQNAALPLESPTADQLHACGIALERQGRFEDAADAYRGAIALRPEWPEAHFHLANALYGGGDVQGAVDMYQRAIALRPAYAEPFNNMGIALRALGRSDEAIAAFRRAVEINSDYADAHTSLGMALRELGDLDASEAACRRALAVQPDSSVAMINLGNTLMTAGQVDDAITFYRRARTIDPDSIAGHGLLFALNFSPRYTPAQIAAEHARWEESYVLPRVRPRTRHENSREPDRRLRIGYVSSDFRDHVIGRFMLPLLSNHDHREVEIFCYAGAPRPDHFTQKLRACADRWFETGGMSLADLAQRIEADRIDILVDLAMHDGPGLMLFAQRPAPVQAAYLAYAGTTGLHAIDYRLTDAYLDPPDTGSVNIPGAGQRFFVEKPVRLRTYWCYQAHENAPPVAPAPSLSPTGGGAITFGCLNNFSKTNRGVLELWREVLQAVPSSRLILHAHEGAHRRRARDFFAAGGVAPGRVEFVGSVPHQTYLRQYNQIDVALDPFPFAGATTTCDALYMGVPVITLPGEAPASRGGLSILSTIGLPELVAKTKRHYVELASALAQNPSRLADLRGGLRNQMLASPLMAAAQFAGDVERCYRLMWRQWCANRSRSDGGDVDICQVSH